MGDDVVITCFFPFQGKTTRGNPNEWITPVHRAGDSRHNLNDPVMALDVHEFVHEHNANAVFTPIF